MWQGICAVILGGTPCRGKLRAGSCCAQYKLCTRRRTGFNSSHAPHLKHQPRRRHFHQRSAKAAHLGTSPCMVDVNGWLQGCLAFCITSSTCQHPAAQHCRQLNTADSLPLITAPWHSAQQLRSGRTTAAAWGEEASVCSKPWDAPWHASRASSVCSIYTAPQPRAQDEACQASRLDRGIPARSERPQMVQARSLTLPASLRAQTGHPGSACNPQAHSPHPSSLPFGTRLMSIRQDKMASPTAPQPP